MPPYLVVLVRFRLSLQFFSWPVWPEDPPFSVAIFVENRHRFSSGFFCNYEKIAIFVSVLCHRVPQLLHNLSFMLSVLNIEVIV